MTIQYLLVKVMIIICIASYFQLTFAFTFTKFYYSIHFPCYICRSLNKCELFLTTIQDISTALSVVSSRSDTRELNRFPTIKWSTLYTFRSWSIYIQFILKLWLSSFSSFYNILSSLYDYDIFRTIIEYHVTLLVKSKEEK